MAKVTKSGSSGSFTLGRGKFGKISAVEGIHMSRDMKRTFGEFDSKKLSPEQRRDALTGKFGSKR